MNPLLTSFKFLLKQKLNQYIRFILICIYFLQV